MRQKIAGVDFAGANGEFGGARLAWGTRLESAQTCVAITLLRRQGLRKINKIEEPEIGNAPARWYAMIRKLRPVVIAPLLLATSLLARVPANLAPFSTFLKANSSIQQVATDAQGFIYVFGETSPSPVTGYSQDVFVARLDPAATKRPECRSARGRFGLGGSATSIPVVVFVKPLGLAFDSTP